MPYCDPSNKNGALPTCRVLGGSKNHEPKKNFGKATTCSSRCWQLKHFLFSPRIPGEDEPNLTCAYFSTGLVKNHQLVFDGFFAIQVGGKFPEKKNHSLQTPSDYCKWYNFIEKGSPKTASDPYDPCILLFLGGYKVIT